MCFLLTFGIAVQIKTVNGTGTTVSTNSKENELRAVLMLEPQFPAIYQQLISNSNFASSSARHF